MNLIKFNGKNKRDCVKKAVSFFYDNFEENDTLEIFLAKCRMQKDGKSLHFYPSLSVNIEQIRKAKENRKKKNES